MYTIKEVAEKLDVNPNAIRFYEKKNLIKPERMENNYRQYNLNDISKMQLIILYRKMGFSIEAISKLIDDKKNQDLLDQFVYQYNVLNQQIHAFTAIREELGACIQEMLNEPEISESMLRKMEHTSEVIAKSCNWKDEWNFGSWAESYDQDIRIPGSGLDFYKNYDEVMARTAAGVCGEKVVEIGIGTGNLAKKILENGIDEKRYIGIDQSVNMLKQAKKKCPGIELRIGTYLQLPLGEKECDTIVSSYAFHHCDHQEKKLAIAEMDRVLNYHGKIIITDLMFENMDARKAFENGCTDRERKDLADEYFGNVDEIEEIFASHGFSCQHEQIDHLIWMITAWK